jgi:membrane protease YdiL (CAAX protease family)
MLQGILSKYSAPAKLGILIGLLLVFLLFSSLLGILMMVPILGTDVLNQISFPDLSNPSIVTAQKLLQVISMAGGLLLPALIFIYLTEPDPIVLFAIPSPRPFYLFSLTAILLLTAQPLIGYLNEINTGMKLPGVLSGVEQWMREMEDQAARITEAFLGTRTFQGFLFNTFMIAILPAVSEEILFRGALARLMKEWTRSIHWAVILSAVIFAAIHLQFYGFLPRFILGVVLGYLYFLTGSLWVPIFAHFINNFLSVLVEYLYRNGWITVNAEQLGVPSTFWAVFISLILSAGIFYLVYTQGRRDKIPNKV